MEMYRIFFFFLLIDKMDDLYNWSMLNNFGNLSLYLGFAWMSKKKYFGYF